MKLRSPLLTLLLLAALGTPAQDSPPPIDPSARSRLLEAYRNQNRPQVVRPAPPVSEATTPANAQSAAAVEAPAVNPPSVSAVLPTPPVASEITLRPSYNQTPLDIVFQEIEKQTGKVILRDPKVANVNITLMSRRSLSQVEFLRAMDSILAMNNIALVPFRDDFLKAVPADTVAKSGIEVQTTLAGLLDEEDQVVSQVIALKHMEYAEVQSLITERLSTTAKIQPIERANSLLITDTRNNLRRVLEVLEFIDRPAEVREELKIYPIVHAKAADIKARIEELIADSQAEQNRVRSTTTRTTPVAPVRGVIRPGTSTATTAGNDLADAAPSPGLISGKVQIVADERTNILIIKGRKENDTFFEEMITALDKKVDPETTVEIYTLEFADAEEVAATLNELIGAATRENPASTATTTPGTTTEDRAGRSLREFILSRTPTDANNPNARSSDIGQISSETKILADKRTNSIILMGRAADLAILRDVVSRLDVMLAQVLIEVVILEVNLTDNFSYGIDWLQSSMTTYDNASNSSVPARSPITSFGGGQNLNGGTLQDAGGVGTDTSLPAGALTYWASFYELNLDAVISLAQGNGQAKIISTPVIITTDNTEAQIIVGERRPIPTTQQTTIGGSIQQNFEYENIGLDINVTPRINPNNVVGMDIKQSADNVGGTVSFNGNDVPIITTRQLQASVAIKSGSTLVLGGLVSESNRDTVSKVPLLGDIPLLGALFRREVSEEVRTELLVLITPYVMKTTDQAEKESLRLKENTELSGKAWQRGWSNSPLAAVPETAIHDEEEAEAPLR